MPSLPDTDVNDPDDTRAFVLEREQVVPRALGETFAFFADPCNLEVITPPELRFRILTPRPIAMAAGAVIEYRLRLFGIPFGWRTLIERYEVDRCFVDRQQKGPYRLWRHWHGFETNAAGTCIQDRVEYRLHFGTLGRAIHAVVVRRTLDRIFDYRSRIIREILSQPAAKASARA